MAVFVWNWIEALGYVAGLLLAFALLPQVVHTYRTQSTKDISYGWQIMYLTGLVLYYVYLVLSGVTAGWVTLTFEVVMAFFLFGMKLRNDGIGDCCRRFRAPNDADKETTQLQATAHDEETGESDDAHVNEAEDVDAWMDQLDLNGLFEETSPSTTGYHVVLTVDNVSLDAISVSDMVHVFVKELQRLSTVHYGAVPSCRPHVETFDSTAPPHEERQNVNADDCASQGFAVSAVLGTSGFISIFYNASDNMLCIDYNCRRYRGHRHGSCRQRTQRGGSGTTDTTTSPALLVVAATPSSSTGTVIDPRTFVQGMIRVIRRHKLAHSVDNVNAGTVS